MRRNKEHCFKSTSPTVLRCSQPGGHFSLSKGLEEQVVSSGTDLTSSFSSLSPVRFSNPDRKFRIKMVTISYP